MFSNSNWMFFLMQIILCYYSLLRSILLHSVFQHIFFFLLLLLLPCGCGFSMLLAVCSCSFQTVIRYFKLLSSWQVYKEYNSLHHLYVIRLSRNLLSICKNIIPSIHHRVVSQKWGLHSLLHFMHIRPVVPAYAH